LERKAAAEPAILGEKRFFFEQKPKKERLGKSNAKPKPGRRPADECIPKTGKRSPKRKVSERPRGGASQKESGGRLEDSPSTFGGGGFVTKSRKRGGLPESNGSAYRVLDRKGQVQNQKKPLGR